MGPLALFCVLALLFLFPVTLGGQALLPTDNLYLTPPWSAYAAEQGVTTPHNPLIADMILQNYSWKTFIRESYRNGELPLWNPSIFAGMPFLAAGQYAALYPPGLLFVVLPVALAYGWFTALHLVLGGAFMYAFLRALGRSRAAATLGGVAFMFCGFLVVSFLWPMVVSSAIWLPFLLLCAERILQSAAGRGLKAEWSAVQGVGATDPARSELVESPSPLLVRQAHHERMTTPLTSSTEDSELPSGLRPQASILLWTLVGAVGLTLHLLAGHLEISFYVLFTVLMYSLFRLALLWRDAGLGAAMRAFLGLAAMALMGLGLAGVQLIPFYELIKENYRAGQVSAHEVLGWALPLRQVAAFLMPDVFGNPTHHTYFDLLTWTVEPITSARDQAGEARNYPFWGIKNYVEGTAYIGVLPLLLAVVALLRRWDRTTAFFVGYGIFCLLLAFGSPVYALLFYGVPGFDQVHSPFRWTFPWAVSTIVLAAVGLDRLLGALPSPRPALALHPPAPSSQVWEEGEERQTVLSRHPPAPSSQVWEEGMQRQTVLSRPLPTLGGGSPFDGAQGKLRAAAAGAGLIVAWTALLTGGTLLAGAALSRLWVDRSLAYVTVLWERSPALAAAFATAQMLYSYEMWSIIILGLLLLAGGCLLLISRHPSLGRAVPVLAVALLALDLFHFGSGFNAATDPALPTYIPPSLRLLQEDPDHFRITTFGEGHVLRPNSAMLAGLQDIRGYDTIIPRQYVDYWRLLEEPSGLIYSQINRLADPRSLTSPLLDLLNVKYIITTDHLNLPGLTPVYRGEVNVYRNEDVLPRAYAVFQMQHVFSKEETAAALADPAFNPRKTVVLDGPGNLALSTVDDPPLAPARILSYRPNQVTVAVTMPQEGYLVLGDQYFAGWRARTETGQDVPVLRANGIFRAVHLGPGEHTVTFRYAPSSFRLGFLVSLMAGAAYALGAGILVWRWRFPAATEFSAAGRVVKNSVTPMAAQLLGRAVDFAFAVFMLRVLGPTEYGNYAFAVVLIGYFTILTDFGLGTLLTREVARARAETGRYLTNVALVRLALCVASAPVLALVLWVYARFFGLAESAVLATLLFLVSLFPSAVSATISALFNAYERMEYPAMVMIITTLLRTAAGVMVLLMGWGVVGLALASVVASTATAVIFVGLYLRTFPREPERVVSARPELVEGQATMPRSWFDKLTTSGTRITTSETFTLGVGSQKGTFLSHLDPRFGWALLGASFPLMINQFLNTIFFRVDVLFLQPLHGSEAVGYYSTAYKFIDGLIIIPSLFTLALFPVLSRHAAVSSETLLRTYSRAVKALLIVALPITVGMTVIAEQLILTFFGPEFAPSVLALQVLIWFLPFSYINGVTQYVLIAAGRQRFITVAFLIGTGFNIVGNTLLIPHYSFIGAGATTVLSEVVLLGPFLWDIRRHVGPLPLGRLLVRPALAALIMGLVLLSLQSWSMFTLVPLGMIIYGAALLLVGAFDAEDRKLAARLGWSRTR